LCWGLVRGRTGVGRIIFLGELKSRAPDLSEGQSSKLSPFPKAQDVMAMSIDINPTGHGMMPWSDSQLRRCRRA
jgi:hypothetical protein